MPCHPVLYSEHRRWCFGVPEKERIVAHAKSQYNVEIGPGIVGYHGLENWVTHGFVFTNDPLSKLPVIFPAWYHGHGVPQ